ncbi:MAG TPA: serine/threonine protein kinase [Phycisphaerales bacterium]|nr:serine/threonine protein kinase [Phycisphaerales bacterium]
MTKSDFPTDPNAETVGLPSDDSGKGSVPEQGKFVTTGMPSEIGRYKILGVIASGGMGVVYEAMQEAPRRRVALKIIKAGAGSDMALRRFQFEAQTLAKLSHPNIAQIFEAGTWESENGESPFFAMEYIPGAIGFVEYAQKRDLSIKDRLELFQKICEAVHHGHQKGVIHRDLKPDNILVDNQGEPKIIDFGVARATDADLAVTTMQTTMGQLIGTLQYMSPEQCDADPDCIDTRSDVYALGVILFQLLSGKLPYDLRRQAIHEAVRVIKEQRPESLGTISTTLKGDIDTIALKAMEKDRERRYQSAAELASDIHHFLNNEPILARPLSISYQLRLFTKKYKRTCAAVILLAISVMLGLVGTTMGYVEANRQKVVAEKQTIIAEEQRNIAQAGFDEILGMSHMFGGEFYNGIVKLNAASEVRKLVLDTTLGYLENLQTKAGDSPEIRAEIALIYLRQGAFFGSVRGSSEGDYIQALKYYQKAIVIFEDLVASGELKHQFNLAISYNFIFDMHWVKEEYIQCLEALVKADSHYDKYVAAFPELSVMRLKDSFAMSRIDTYGKLGDVAKVNELLKDAISSRRNRVALNGNEPTFKRDLANILQRTGYIKWTKKEYADASAYYTEARNIYQGLVAESPENGRAPRDLAWCTFFLGESILDSGELDNGLDTIEIALVLLQDRLVLNTDDADARNDLVRMVDPYAFMCQEGQRIGRSDAFIRKMLAVIQPVVEANSTNFALADMFVQVQKNLSETDETTLVEQ